MGKPKSKCVYLINTNTNNCIDAQQTKRASAQMFVYFQVFFHSTAKRTFKKICFQEYLIDLSEYLVFIITFLEKIC